jgi:Putative peptidoglycan binding domain
MKQYGWQPSQSGDQGWPQQQTGAGKVTRTDGFPAGGGDAVQMQASAGGSSTSWPAGSSALGDPYLDMASLGLGGDPSIHPVPTDVFLKVVAETKLSRLESDGAPPMIGPQEAPELVPTTVVMEAGKILRAATRADRPPFLAGQRFITDAAELFGWVPVASVAEMAAPPDPVAGAEELDEEVPDNGELPQLSAEDYDDLVLLNEEATLYAHPGPSVTVLAVAERMESVVYVGEAIQVEGKRWQQVKLVRKPPILGWMKAPSGDEVSTQMLGSSLDGERMLSLELNSTGPEVRELEAMLAELGHKPGVIDETFDADTDKAVRAFQDWHPELDDDGLVGIYTVRALRETVAERRAKNNGGEEPPLPVGTWVGGFRLRDQTPGRSATIDGKAPASNTEEDPGPDYGEAAQGGASMMKDGCEVLHQNGSPVVFEAVDGTRWYVRGADGGGAGWVMSGNILPATGEDGEAVVGTETDLTQELAALCPNGITVAFVVPFADRVGRQFDTFLREGASFAAMHHAVAVSAGSLVTGTVNWITHKDQIVGTLASIQRALRGGAETLPDWARIAHLAFFTHGSYTDGGNWGGLQTDADNVEQDGNLRGRDLEGFARTLTAYCTSDVEVSLFACSTGMEDLDSMPAGGPEAQNYQNWLQQEDQTGGETGFADQMADLLAAAGVTDPMVLGHTTVGHTVQNPAARLFTGSDQGGVNIFNWVFLPLQSWLGTELADIERSKAAAVPLEFLEFKLFAWFRDEVILASSRQSMRMSTDPELFKVEVRDQAVAWIHEQYFGWGVASEEMFATRRAILSPTSGNRPPNYPFDRKPPTIVEIAVGTVIEVQGPEEQINGIRSVPVTWEGDPYGPDSEQPVQAYLPSSWIEYVYGE